MLLGGQGGLHLGSGAPAAQDDHADHQHADGTLGLDLGVYGAPETYLIDKQGIIRHKIVGVVDQKVWREQLAPLYQQLLDEPEAR